MRTFVRCVIAILFLTSVGLAHATDFVGQKKFLVLRVQSQDATATTYTATQAQTQFDEITTLWGPHSSYGKIQPKFQISSLFKLPGNFTDYIDNGDSSSVTAFYKTVSDAVANAPSGLDWSNLQGVVIFLADTRSGTTGFTRGVTYPGVTVNAPGGNISLPVSLVTEDPSEGLPQSWGRIAHEVGHAMQQGGPPHPSNYASSFEQMDGEYPAQTGVFEKEADKAYPGWLPPAKYISVNPPTGTASTIWAAENDPTGQPDAQALKAFPAFGGTTVYYLVSVRRRLLGDDLDVENPAPPAGDCDATIPNGIPDCGVLIERVVEGGDPNLSDCDGTNCTNRWVHVLGKGNDATKLWQEGDVFDSASYGDLSASHDAISISVRKKSDQDHYTVYVQYNRDGLSHPDIGINDWLRPPANTYETTDIWVDSPVNGYANPPNDPASYRYGAWSDGMSGTVPTGNGDDPAIGQVNRLYARVRNFGTQPATNVKVNFDVTDPLGLGITGSNGFKQLGTVDSSAFPGLASIAPGASVDVYIEWQPNVSLTAAQLAAGHFYFHSCVRVRIDGVSGETFLANQDGDGEQENIEYFDATSSSPSSPGAPGAPNKAIVHLKNDSMSATKTFSLALLRDTLPASWKVEVNGGIPLVTLPPGGSKDISVVVKQTANESIGSRHRVRLIASSQMTLTSSLHKTPHSEVHTLSGVTFEVGVLRKTSLVCKATKDGVVGVLRGFDPKDRHPRIFLVQIKERDKYILFARKGGRLANVSTSNGRFIFRDVPKGKEAVCLYAGSLTDTSAASRPFIQ